MYARATTVQVHLDKIDEGNSIFSDSVILAAKARKGFRAGYLIIHRTTGKGMAISAWDTLEGLLANEASGYYQEQLTKFAPLLATAPGRETYIAGVQA